MKILLVGNYPPPYGGISAHVETLARRLTHETNAMVTVLDVDMHAAAQQKDVVTTSSRISFMFSLLSMLFGVEVVHLHTNGHNNKSWLLISLVAILGKMTGKTAIVTVHSGGAPSYISELTGLRKLLFQKFLRLYDSVISVNDSIRASLQHWGVKRERLYCIPAYLGLRCEPQPLGDAALERFFTEHSPVLCSIVAFRPEYGLDTLLELCEKMRGANPDCGIVVIGSGGDSQKFRDMILAKRLSESFHLLIDSPPETTYAVLKKSAIFLRLTEYDGDAVSVREALSLGVAVVATDTAFRPSGVKTYAYGDMKQLIEVVTDTLTLRAESVADDRGHRARDFFHEICALYRREVRESTSSL